MWLRNRKNSDFKMTKEITKVEKPWGYELIWAKTNDYVGKVLHINKGHKLSLQYHEEKEETILLSAGRMNLVFENDEGELEDILLEAGQALEDCDVFEVSTPQLDDVVRLEDGYGRT
jgi:mannose-6-phosphate isomerase